MKITIEKDGRVKSLEPDAAIVLALKGESFMEVLQGTLAELGMLLGNSEPLAEHWDTLSKLVAIVKIMKEEEDTTAGKGAIQ